MTCILVLNWYMYVELFNNVGGNGSFNSFLTYCHFWGKILEKQVIKSGLIAERRHLQNKYR